MHRLDGYGRRISLVGASNLRRQRATICLSPPFVAFDSRALEKLPLGLVFTIICPVAGRQVNFAATKSTPNALCLNADIECTGIYRST